MRRHILKLCTASLLLAASLSAWSQAWPSKPIRFVVPTAAGGDVDFVARLVGRKISESLGQPVVIDNRPGAGTQLGTDLVAKAAPDGYTFLVPFSPHLGNPGLYAKLPYDTLKDFEAVSMIVGSPLLIVVSSSLPVNSLNELVAWSKANPGKLNYATGSVADFGHLTGARLKIATGLQTEHIPYKGGSAAINDLLGGQINMMIGSPGAMMAHLQAGKIKPIAVSGLQRLEILPNVPTIAEALGDRSFDMSSFYGLLAPAGTPRDIVERMSAEMAKAVRTPEVRDTLTARGFKPMGGTPQELKAYIDRGVTQATAIVKQANIKPE